MEPLLGDQKGLISLHVERHRDLLWRRAQHNSLTSRIIGALFKLLVLGFTVILVLYTPTFWKYIFQGGPDTSTMPFDGFHPWCPPITESFQRSFEFNDLKDFSLHNLIQPDSRHHTLTKGSIQILQGKSQKADIVVDFSFNTSDATLLEYLEFTQEEESLVLNFPKTPIPPEELNGRQCIETETLIYVRDGFAIDQFDLESRVFSVIIPSELDFSADTTKITISAGSLRASPMFKSRETYVKDHAGSVRGQFSVYDVLDIATEAGSISIDAFPQEASSKAEHPAVLSVHSHAGSVNAQYPPNGIKIPTREYRTDIGSHAGGISGRYIHGVKTSVKSTLGSIKAEIIPLAADNYPSELTTESTSGSLHIKVLSPYLSDQNALRRLDANHISQHGSIHVAYPSQWEGTVEAVSSMGSVRVHGEGLKVVKEGRNGIGKFIEAKKGNGLTALCKTSMGSVHFEIVSDA
jgi:hypothetical protein